MDIHLTGFHGSSFENAKQIISNDFELSYGDEEWLGDGIYFFIEGLSRKPIYQAEKWAIVQAWDNKNKTNKYSRYSVIKSDILVSEDCFLDLTTADGIEIFEYLKERFEDKIGNFGKRFKNIDGQLINLARNENILPIEVSKGNFYIKFSKERISQLNQRTPNCTICSVYDNKNLQNIEIIRNNEISDETY